MARKPKIYLARIGGIPVKVQEYKHKVNIITERPLRASAIEEYLRHGEYSEVRRTKRRNPLIVDDNPFG